MQEAEIGRKTIGSCVVDANLPVNRQFSPSAAIPIATQLCATETGKQHELVQCVCGKRSGGGWTNEQQGIWKHHNEVQFSGDFVGNDCLPV